PFTFSRDLKTFAAVYPDHSLGLWDLPTGKEVRRFESGQKDLSCLAISPDGRILASGGGKEDRTVRVWDLTRGKEVWRSGPCPGWVDSVAFSPDSKALAVGEQFGTIRVFAAADGKEVCRCGLRKGSWVRALTFSPDGKTLAGGGTE